MAQITVIFNKAIILPDDEMKRLKNIRTCVRENGESNI